MGQWAEYVSLAKLTARIRRRVLVEGEFWAQAVDILVDLLQDLVILEVLVPARVSRAAHTPQYRTK
jgi:hypothetical protein